MTQLVITAEIVTELELAVECAYGEKPTLRSFCPDPSSRPLLAYIGKNPGYVAYELSVILATVAAESAYRAGYEFSALDIIEEVRHLLVVITPSRSQVIGHQVVFYWPNIEYVEDRLGGLGCGHHRGADFGVIGGKVPLGSPDAGMAQ